MEIASVQYIAHPLPDVLAWHERPGALVRLTPPGLASVEDPSAGGMRPGRRVGVRLGPPFLPTPVRPHWVLEHRDQGEGGESFVDEQVQGPWRSWRHEHRFAAEGSGTTLHDTVRFELPPGLGAGGGLATREVRRVLDFRTRQLRDDLAVHARFADSPPRTVAITGASGLLGTQLTAFLETGGHTVLRMVRREAGEGEIRWDPRTGLLDPADLAAVDVVVNLAGSSIATRWTDAARRAMRSSRVDGTALLARTIAGLRREGRGPEALVQASAIGLYGPRRPGELLVEDDPGGEGFLADLVRDWEAAAQPARDAGARVTEIRTGLVLSDGGGPLAPQLPLFLAGVGGRLTDARAMLSWITLDDVVRVFAAAALSDAVSGPVNAVSGNPVTAARFARTLGRVLHRPALLPVPRSGPELLLGRAGADEVIRTDQQVSAARLHELDLPLAHPQLEQALRHVLRR